MLFVDITSFCIVMLSYLSPFLCYTITRKYCIRPRHAEEAQGRDQNTGD